MNNKARIIVINGSGGSGKDTFVRFCQEAYNDYPDCFIIGNCSTIDGVKAIARSVGWNGNKNEKDRKFLSDLKAILSDYNDFPNKSVKKSIELFEEYGAKVVFVHCREPKNIDWFVRNHNAYTLLITNDNIPVITSNASDANVFKYHYDKIIENNGSLDELKEKAINFIKDFIGE